ncbi:hypothetical protein, partial [Brevibacterium litoralis]|uniref:hypothetical protein n=1 Tax=Brevibacterium litoralis TaxID=3138935 RepID=UPI0032EF3159
GDTHTALVRVEQLYPLDEAAIARVLSTYPDSARFVWAQEEPENQGAWPFMALNLTGLLGDRELTVASRPAAAAPATGLKKVHDAEQAALVEKVLAR